MTRPDRQVSHPDTPPAPPTRPAPAATASPAARTTRRARSPKPPARAPRTPRTPRTPRPPRAASEPHVAPPVAPPGTPPPGGLTYASAGVDLESKDRFTESLERLMKRTHGPRVIPNPGGFAGLFRLDYNKGLFRRNYRDPVLVACCDGVGTKLKLAQQAGWYEGLGIDLVAMNVNDMIVQGAEPLFFLDYLAVGAVDHARLHAIFRGIVEGCRRAGCALLGGETAEMPGVYARDDFDLAGFAVGVVELARGADTARVEPGDVVLGLASDGIHSNGFTLVRKVVEHAGLDLHAVYPELLGERAATPRRRRRAEAAPATTANATTAPATTTPGPEPSTLGRVLLTPTRIYVPAITKLLRSYRVKRVITGMAHITGSGLAGNLCRALHPRVDAVIDPSSWPEPAVFSFLRRHGQIGDEEMRRVFNMGVGYCLIVRPTFAKSVATALRRLGERVYTIGSITRGKGQVVLKGATP